MIRPILVIIGILLFFSIEAKGQTASNITREVFHEYLHRAHRFQGSLTDEEGVQILGRSVDFYKIGSAVAAPFTVKLMAEYQNPLAILLSPSGQSYYVCSYNMSDTGVQISYDSPFRI